jgi:hypothetical protein
MCFNDFVLLQVITSTNAWLEFEGYEDEGDGFGIVGGGVL